MDASSYVITEEKRKLFDKLLELLQEFDRVCRENEITYYASGGTLLGAVRHGGFIPWDDDVDVILPRADYEKLKTVAGSGGANGRGAFSEPFFFQNPSTDEGYPKGFSRLRNSNTAEIPYDDVAMNCNRGIFIDIFPLDYAPEDGAAFQMKIRTLRRIRMFLNCYARYYSGFGCESTTGIKKLAYYCMVPLFRMKLLTADRMFQRLEKEAAGYGHGGSPCRKWGTLTGTFDEPRFIYDTALFDGEAVLMPFETMRVPVPSGYHAMLTHVYGDYMTPVQAPTEHGDMLYSTTQPYGEFIRQHAAELKQGWLKQTEIGRRNRQSMSGRQDKQSKI